MVRMKTVSLQSFYKRKRDESDVGEEEDQAPPILQLGDLEPQRQEGNEEAAAAQLDELDQLRQGEQEAAVANELDDSEPQRQEVQEEAIGIAEEDTEGAGAEEEENQRNEHIMFRGIEFLERDPALRPQIWQYPNDQRDQVRRAYLQLGPMQPLLKKYKPSGPQGHQRRFNYIWFSQFPSWLEYSESSGRAYCFFCFLCSKNIKKRGGFDVFTAQGFDNWKKVNDGKKCGFLVHVGSTPCSQHNNAVRECQAILNQPNHIENILEEATDREKERNRLRLRTSIAAVKWLTFQSCAFRGRDETPQSKKQR